MTAAVDAAARCVRLGHREWPFELDCRTGAATLELDGRHVRVRPVVWREKLVLARFAHLGDEFLGEQLLRLVSDEAPADDDEREALDALAAWVNVAAAGEDGLPLRTSLLATVTLEVCRAIGIGPADLDARDAFEVQALWQAASGRAAAPGLLPQADEHGESRQPRPRTSRILFVPEPAATRVESARGGAIGEQEDEQANGTRPAVGDAPESSGTPAPAAEPQEREPTEAARGAAIAEQEDERANGTRPAVGDAPESNSAPAPVPASRPRPRVPRAAVRRFQPLPARNAPAAAAPAAAPAPSDEPGDAGGSRVGGDAARSAATGPGAGLPAGTPPLQTDPARAAGGAVPAADPGRQPRGTGGETSGSAGAAIPRTAAIQRTAVAARTAENLQTAASPLTDGSPLTAGIPGVAPTPPPLGPMNGRATALLPLALDYPAAAPTGSSPAPAVPGVAAAAWPTARLPVLPRETAEPARWDDDEREALFDELTERLERAAAALGIEPRG